MGHLPNYIDNVYKTLQAAKCDRKSNKFARPIAKEPGAKKTDLQKIQTCPDFDISDFTCSWLNSSEKYPAAKRIKTESRNCQTTAPEAAIIFRNIPLFSADKTGNSNSYVKA
jgi:hypothetical protein